MAGPATARKRRISKDNPDSRLIYNSPALVGALRSASGSSVVAATRWRCRPSGAQRRAAGQPPYSRLVTLPNCNANLLSLAMVYADHLRHRQSGQPNKAI